MSASEDENAERDLEKEIEETDDLRGELQKVVFEIDERLNLTMPATTAALSPPQTEPAKVTRAKLPKLHVKRFGGKVQKWQEFRESFDSSVHQNECFSEVDKFSYLRSLLTDP